MAPIGFTACTFILFFVKIVSFPPVYSYCINDLENHSEVKYEKTLPTGVQIRWGAICVLKQITELQSC